MPDSQQQPTASQMKTRLASKSVCLPVISMRQPSWLSSVLNGSLHLLPCSWLPSRFRVCAHLTGMNARDQLTNFRPDSNSQTRGVPSTEREIFGRIITRSGGNKEGILLPEAAVGLGDTRSHNSCRMIICQFETSSRAPGLINCQGKFVFYAQL